MSDPPALLGCPRSVDVPGSSDTPSCPMRSHRDPSELNPLNMMPSIPNTAPQDGETEGLSLAREMSTIPKNGNSNEVWEYPSPLQFFRALQRREKPADADVMDSVVFVHNRVNEDTWRHIVEWEGMHQRKCPNPSLLRFCGRYGDTSPKAWWRSKTTSLALPFDRHDWTVDRCGTHVRYVVDYYDDPAAANDYEVTIDARPALDSFGAFWDRIRRPLLQLFWRV